MALRLTPGNEQIRGDRTCDEEQSGRRGHTHALTCGRGQSRGTRLRIHSPPWCNREDGLHKTGVRRSSGRRSRSQGRRDGGCSHGDRHVHIHGDRVRDRVHICKKKIGKISNHFLFISYTTLKSMNFATVEIRDE